LEYWLENRDLTVGVLPHTTSLNGQHGDKVHKTIAIFSDLASLIEANWFTLSWSNLQEPANLARIAAF
jgi:hypothetical protein